MVSTLTSTLCGPPSVLSIPPISTDLTGSEIHLGWKVVLSARMKALMQHYKAAVFSDEVSRLAAAPRRPSTNCMYDDWWLHFTHWVAREGFDPLNPTAAQIAAFSYSLFEAIELVWAQCLTGLSKAKVVHQKTISDMIASMELQRPRVTPVLPQWDIGIVLEALCRPPYEPLREASLNI